MLLRHFGSGRRIRRLVLAGVIVSLPVTACGSPAEKPAQTTTGVARSNTVADAVGWMDGFCGAVFGLLKDNNAVSPSPAGLTSAENQHSISKLLGDYAAIAGKAVNGLNALPASPDATAESAKKTFLNHYTVARDEASSAKATLDAASPSDFSAQMSAADAMTTVQQEMFAAADPVGSITASPTLSAAAATAPRCRPGA